VRLFVSLPLPVERREHLERALMGRPSAPERWHITLAFLGDRDDDVADALASVSAAPFELHLAGSGSFPGVEWAGVSGDLDALSALAADVAAACRVQQGVYRPHVTIGRRGRVSLPASYVGPSWTVSSFDLVHSTLGRPVVHDVLASFPF